MQSSAIINHPPSLSCLLDGLAFVFVSISIFRVAFCLEEAGRPFWAVFVAQTGDKIRLMLWKARERNIEIESLAKRTGFVELAEKSQFWMQVTLFVSRRAERDAD